MTNLELAKKALARLKGGEFNLIVRASEGGACGYGYDGEDSVELYQDQIAFLLKDRVSDRRVFDGIKMEEVNLDAIFEEKAREDAWPDGDEIRAYVNDSIPEELDDLSYELSELDTEDEEALGRMREQLMAITDGEYTFYFTLKKDGDYYLGEHEEAQLSLTANEVLGLLYGSYDMKEVFEGICDQRLDEDYINDKVEEEGIFNEEDDDYYDGYSYSGESQQLDNYLDSWVYLLNNILSGNITEEQLDSWLRYFDEKDYSWKIEFWHDTTK